MTLETVNRFEFEDVPREECGVFGVICLNANPDAKDLALGPVAYQGILGLQHRGEDGAGISVFDPTRGRFETVKDKGLITDVFAGGRYASTLPDGPIALAHTRYGTGKKSGDAAERARQAHPLGGKDSLFMLALNGHMKELENRRNMTDTEHLVDIIDRRMLSTGEDFRTSLLTVLRGLNGGYSLVASDGVNLYGARDPWGFRPLFEAKTDRHHFLISEDSALGPLTDPRNATEIQPGTLVTIPLNGGEPYSEEIYQVDETKTCLMEFAYFDRPDSSLHGRSIRKVRMRMGEILARSEDPDFTASMVVGIPDSGTYTALGYSQATGIPFEHVITKNPYVGRSFILENQERRAETVKLKLRIDYSQIEGEDLVVIDDSVVRGTSARVYIDELWKGHPRSIHLRIAYPPHLYSCQYGIDTGMQSELVARRKNLDEMQKYFGVTSLRFITVDELEEAIESTPPWRQGVATEMGKFCTACATGDYPTAGRPVDLNLLTRKELKIWPLKYQEGRALP
jgi:amidophosphoribosyltransferase